MAIHKIAFLYPVYLEIDDDDLKKKNISMEKVIEIGAKHFSPNLIPIHLQDFVEKEVEK